MPIYEFFCPSCRRKCELLIGLGKENGALCPGCGAKNLQKLVSSFGIGGGSSRLSSSSAGCSSCSAKSCSTCR